MKLLGYKYAELLWAIALLLVIPIWMGLASEWYLWYGGKDNCLWMKQFYDLLDGCWLVNIPICLILGYFAFHYYYRIYKDNDFRLFRLPLVLIGLVFLYWESQVVYAKIVWNVDYRMFFMSLLLGALLLIIIKSATRNFAWCSQEKKGKKLGSDRKKRHKAKGISNNDAEEENVPENLKIYALSIIKKLEEISISKHSHAIGITGEWGVGKTTFLNHLKKEVKDIAEVVEFNPWMCRTPEQVTRDLFASLRYQLSPKYSKLSKPIKEYAKYLSNLTLTSSSTFTLNTILPLGEESLYMRKKKLSEKFSHLPCPVVVFIDDLDRLEREEVFEVIRLIRNTADLSNTIYVVAYDKGYVTSVLEEKNIQDASAYLEKIFPMEVYLPKVEDYLIWKVFCSDIDAQCSHETKHVKSLLSQFDHNKRSLILRVLNNYRRAKRFAQLYMLNVSYMYRYLGDEFDLSDLFWLELLQMYDKRTYNELANEPNRLLFLEKEKYRIRSGVSCNANLSDKNTCYTGPKFWKEETPKILQMMFGDYWKRNKKGIFHTENYDKYFTLSISPYRLSFKEVEELFAESTDPDSVVSKWENRSKFCYSIVYQLSQVDVENLSNDRLRAFFGGVLCLGMRSLSNMGKVKEILQEKRYAPNQRVIAHEMVSSWIENKLDKEEAFFDLSIFLKQLYISKEYDERSHLVEAAPLVISNEKVESSLKKVMNHYLEKHPEFTALDVMNINGDLGRLFENCCVTEVDHPYEYVYKQVAFDVVITHFKKKQEKPSQKEYEEAYQTIGNQNIFPLVSNVCDPMEEEYKEYVQSKVEMEFEENIRKYFGGSYKDCKDPEKLEDFRRECFVEEKG